MNAFLAELSKKLAEQWLTLLVLPGLLFVGSCAIGITLGHGRWYDAERLVTAGQRVSTDLDKRGTVAIALALVAIVLAAAASGLLARGIAMAVQQLWLGLWPSPTRWPAKAFVQRRQLRWQDLQDRYAALVMSTVQPADAESIAVKRSRIAISHPRRATWMGDRIAAAESRAYGQYEIDLVAIWPRLWLLLPDGVRVEVRSAHERFQDATAVAAWGTLYVSLGVWWWPAALVGVGVILVGWRMGRVAADGLAELIEATVDVHIRSVATAVGIPVDGDEVTPDIGKRLTRMMRKGA